MNVLFLAFIAIAHLLRFALAVPITVGDATIPVWLSVPAAVATGGLALWLWREQQPVGDRR